LVNGDGQDGDGTRQYSTMLANTAFALVVAEKASFIVRYFSSFSQSEFLIFGFRMLKLGHNSVQGVLVVLFRFLF